MKMYKDTSRDPNSQNLMTGREQAKMNKRAAIAERLAAGQTYREIEKDLKASTSTISLVSRLMKEG